MDSKEIEEQIIRDFQQDEKMMILVFAQWCINNNLDPEEVYIRAYPEQSASPALQDAIQLTVSKKEAEFIANETLLGVLSLFGNEDLTFVVTEEIKKINTR